jgi:hypothetical protein
MLLTLLLPLSKNREKLNNKEIFLDFVSYKFFIT